MINYTYEAKEAKTGKKIKAQVQADNEQNAAKLIKDQGLTPLTIKAERGATSSFLNKVSTKDKVLFSR